MGKESNPTGGKGNRGHWTETLRAEEGTKGLWGLPPRRPGPARRSALAAAVARE